jgi:hypothetical protein
MKIDCEKIRNAFPDRAWAYAESLDSVKIGKWSGQSLEFFDGVKEDLLLLLRVFDGALELKFSGGKCRSTDIYKGGKCIPELAESRYFMYGEQTETCGAYTKIWERRGGILYFPAQLTFPKDNAGLKLGIRNFVRYNPVSVCPKGEAFDFGLAKSGAGALEVMDYAYTGFYYADGKAVEL